MDTSILDQTVMANAFPKADPGSNDFKQANNMSGFFGKDGAH